MADAPSKFAPPHSLDAEKAVLGSVLRDPASINEIVDVLEEHAFFLDAHRKIFSVMVELYQANEPTDILAVSDKLRRFGEASEYLGPGYLVELTESCPVTQNIGYYARIVRNYYYLRRIISACQQTIGRASAFEGDLNSFVEEVEKEFLSIASQQDRQGIALAGEVLQDTLEELEQRIAADGSMTGVPSDFIDLDRITGGWQKSDLIIVAARPGMGKTAFALNCAMNAVKSDKSVAIFTLEMSRNQVMTRIISAEARVDSGKLRRGDLSEEEMDRLMHGVREIDKYSSRLGIDQTPGISLIELRSRCRRFKKEFGLDLVVIDYLQLMTASASKKYDSREREISEISGGLKNLAKELEIPIIALAQLNRGPDSRPDKIPKLSDLRESGSMEQDADQILFLYRDEYYNPNSEDAGKALVRIAKNRHGATEDVYLAFAPNFLKFTNLARD